MKGKKLWSRNDDDSNGQRKGSKTESKYKESTGKEAPALGASQKLDIENTKSLEICGTSKSAYLGMSGVFRSTLAVSALRLNVKKFKSTESCGTSESAYTGGMSDVFRRTLAAAAFSTMQTVCTSMKDLCFDQCGMSKEERDSKIVKGNQEPRPFLQFCYGTISGALGETWTRMKAQHSNANAAYSGLSGVLGRTLVHQSKRFLISIKDLP